MQIRKNCVLLLKAEKSEESEDKYEVMLTQQGFTVKHLRTLEFVFKNLEDLRKKLENPHHYSGIIFTTPRSVRAAKDSLDGASISSDWNAKVNYVVGETTHNLVLKELGLTCRGQESGNASNLADVIINDATASLKPFLFPCGNLKTDTLMNRLREEQIEVEAITVYETVASHNLDREFCDLTADFTDIPEYFVYFSPSGVQSTLEYIRRFTTETNAVKIVALGPTTESALESREIKVSAVAAKPTPGDLLNAILS